MSIDALMIAVLAIFDVASLLCGPSSQPVRVAARRQSRRVGKSGSR